MKISRVFVTHNEYPRTLRAQREMFAQDSDSQVDEILYADSGSNCIIDAEMRYMWKPNVYLKFEENVGIARSHNPLFAVATGDIIILTGCNRVPPEGWVKIFKDHFEVFPDLVAACIFNENVDESQRITGPLHASVSRTTMQIREGVLMDCIAWRREVFKSVGYYQECFGMYGVEDLEFSARVHRWCKENGKFAGFIPGLRNKHYGFDPRIPHDPETSTKDYYELKKAEVERFPEKEKRFHELRAHNFPYFSPY